MDNNKKYDVFISYSNEDKAVVEKLITELRNLELTVWDDESKMDIGDGSYVAINEGLKNSKYAIAVLSHSYFKSDNCTKELNAIQSENVLKILPILHKMKLEELKSENPILGGVKCLYSNNPDLANKIKSKIYPDHTKQFSNDTNKLSIEESRSAMRAFLQRSEVRLSTMHRVAGGFLNGAGLLVLFPIFFRDAPKDILKKLLDKVSFSSMHSNDWANCLVAIVFLISIALPLISLLLLLKDLVNFYFTGHSPGFKDTIFNPRFALTGIAFSPDEDEQVKKQIFKEQYTTDLVNFILPFSQKENKYYDDVYNTSKESIIPKTRTIERIKEAIGENDTKKNIEEINRFNTALGLAGFVDRDLLIEVAKMEVSLVRHDLFLRRLVLRYAKSLLLFIWTTIIILLSVSFIEVFDTLITLLVAYIIWSVSTWYVVKLPITWIYKLGNQNSTPSVQKDSNLSYFENWVKITCFLCGTISIIAILLIISK